jgi:hypothetical protein
MQRERTPEVATDIDMQICPDEHATRRDAELARQGWNRRVVVGPIHLREHVERFWSQGLDVHLEPVPADECAPYTLAMSFYRVIYTRNAT